MWLNSSSEVPLPPGGPQGHIYYLNTIMKHIGPIIIYNKFDQNQKIIVGGVIFLAKDNAGDADNNDGQSGIGKAHLIHCLMRGEDYYYISLVLPIFWLGDIYFYHMPYHMAKPCGYSSAPWIVK